MRRFQVPFDLEFEDKIIGGKLTLRQAGWIFTPVIGLFFSFFNTNLYITRVNGVAQLNAGRILLTLFAFILFMTIGLIMAFKKKYNMNLDKYIIKSISYSLRTKNFKHYE